MTESDMSASPEPEEGGATASTVEGAVDVETSAAKVRYACWADVCCDTGSRSPCQVTMSSIFLPPCRACTATM